MSSDKQLRQVLSRKDFRIQNARYWTQNVAYWLSNPLRHVVDTRPFLREKLLSLVSSDQCVVDMGCGDGWLLDLLLEVELKPAYLGLDFSEAFLHHLRAKHNAYGNVDFKHADFEEPITDELSSIADVVFNLFNFFELTNLRVAFQNAVRMLKPGGKLVILTIDCAYLMLALGTTMEEYRANLRAYEESKAKGIVPYCFQRIDLGESQSAELYYASVLYSLADFYHEAHSQGLALVDYDEVIKTSKFLPKTYQYIVFRKP